MTTVPSRAVDGPPPKTTLWCPDCGHRSRYDGDWRVVTTARDVRYLCPDCETRITVRPRFGDDAVDGPSTVWNAAWRVWSDGVSAWTQAWSRALSRG